MEEHQDVTVQILCECEYCGKRYSWCLPKATFKTAVLNVIDTVERVNCAPPSLENVFNMYVRKIENTEIKVVEEESFECDCHNIYEIQDQIKQALIRDVYQGLEEFAKIPELYPYILSG
jgi:hypothetical protein